MTTGIGVDRAAELGPKDFERLLLRTLTSMKKGDFTVRMPIEFTGVHGKIADTLNDILELNELTVREVEKISNVAARTHTVTGLAKGTWYFVVTALNSQGTESPYSNVWSKTVQ